MIPHDFVVSPYISSVSTQVTILNSGILSCISQTLFSHGCPPPLCKTEYLLGSEAETKASRWRSCGRERGVGGGREVWVTTVITPQPLLPPAHFQFPTQRHVSPGPGGKGAGPNCWEQRKAGTPTAGKLCEPRRLRSLYPGELRPPARPRTKCGRPSHLSGRHDHSLTVPVHTNQDLWVLLWSPFPTFGALCSTRSPLPAATGFPMQSFSRQNLLASSCRKRAHLCRKADRRALSYPGLCRRATSVDRPERGCPFKHWPCPVQDTRRRVWYWWAPWWELICESQSETASGMCSAGRLTVLQRGTESFIQTEWASVGHRPKTGFLAALSLQGLHR